MTRFLKSRRARFAAAGAVALAVGLLASLGAVGYAARLVGVTNTSPTAAQYPPSKVTICHHTHSKKNPFVTITVSEHAVPAHLRHGDTIGPCATQAVEQAAVPAAPSAKKQKPQHAAAKAKVHLKKAMKAKKTHPGRSSLQQNASEPAASQAPSKSTAHGKSDAAQAKVKTKSQGQTKSHGHAFGHDKQQAKQQGSAKNQSHGQGKTNEHSPGNGGNGNGGGGNGGGNGKGH